MGSGSLECEKGGRRDQSLNLRDSEEERAPPACDIGSHPWEGGIGEVVPPEEACWLGDPVHLPVLSCVREGHGLQAPQASQSCHGHLLLPKDSPSREWASISQSLQEDQELPPGLRPNIS